MERYLQTGAFHQARREAERLLQGGELSVEVEAKLLRMACRAAYSLNDHYAASRLGGLAVEKARNANDQETLGLAHFDLGCALVEIGDTHEAERNLLAFLALLPQMTGTDGSQGQAWIKLAAVYKQRRRWDQAAEALESAARYVESEGDRSQRSQVALELAWCHLLRGDQAMAAPQLALVEEHLAEQRNDRLSAELICRKALYHRLERDLTASSRLCQELFVAGRQGVTGRHMAEATWIMGENALDLGQVQEAGLFANQSLEYATRENWTSLLNLAGDLRRKVAERITELS